MTVAGIDMGSFRTLSYVAWLDNDTFFLDCYIPSIDNPLPIQPSFIKDLKYVSIDALQGLPKLGERRRLCDSRDRGAGTPTQILPGSREELVNWTLYAGLIKAGINVFWQVYATQLGRIPGSLNNDIPLTVMEVYPRYTLKRLAPGKPIPSKKNEPLEYCRFVWSIMQEKGYRCPSVVLPSVDQCDAMVCAHVARCCEVSDTYELQGNVGQAPIIDHTGFVLREGYIVSP